METPTPLGSELTVGGRAYQVVKLGTPVCSKSANASHLRSLGFTATNLTVLAALPIEPHSPDLAYVAWCTQAAEQKLATADLLQGLISATPEGELEEASVEVDGVTLCLPATPQMPAHVSKKRKHVDVSRAVETLVKGAFVIDDALMEGGVVSAALQDVSFGEPRAARLAAFAEMLLCIHALPTIDQVHSWARAALGAVEM